LKTGTNQYFWPYSTHEAESWHQPIYVWQQRRGL